jgi:hypothetical protein
MAFNPTFNQANLQAGLATVVAEFANISADITTAPINLFAVYIII